METKIQINRTVTVGMSLGSICLVECTKAEYDSMPLHSANTVYYVDMGDSTSVYQGDRFIAGASAEEV